jgi:hypothetical protein
VRAVLDALAAATGQVLAVLEPPPAQALLVGACEDGLPFLLDLSDPQGGPVLVSADAGCGKTRQLMVMVESGMRLSTPRRLQVAVVTANPDEWRDLFVQPQYSRHLLGCCAWNDPLAADLLAYLLQLCEDRHAGKRLGADVLLALDDLSPLEKLPLQAQSAAQRLLQDGPQVGIWVLAAWRAETAARKPFWTDLFRTRLLGKISADASAQKLAVFEVNLLDRLIPGAEFCAWVDGIWTRYQVPRVGD